MNGIEMLMKIALVNSGIEFTFERGNPQVEDPCFKLDEVLHISIADYSDTPFLLGSWDGTLMTFWELGNPQAVVKKIKELRG